MKKILFISIWFLSSCVVVAQTTPTLKKVLNAGNDANEHRITNVAPAWAPTDVITKIQLDSVKAFTSGVAPYTVPFGQFNMEFGNSTLQCLNSAITNSSAYNGSLKTIATAATLTVTLADSYILTGTVTVTGISKENGSQANLIGAKRLFKTAGIFTLTNSSHLVLPGGSDITTAANDWFEAIETDTTGYAANHYTTWTVFGYYRATGAALH